MWPYNPVSRLPYAKVSRHAHLDGTLQEYPCSKRLTESDVQCLCPNCSERFRKVIYVVRDGRDVMYSYFKFRHGLGQNLRLTFSNFLEVRRHHYPGPKWHEHVESWLEHAREGRVDMLLVKYEDLLVNSTAALERMAAFIGMNATRDGLLWATAVSTADSMRKIEKQKGAGFFEKKYSGVKERRGTPGAHFAQQTNELCLSASHQIAEQRHEQYHSDFLYLYHDLTVRLCTRFRRWISIRAIGVCWPLG